MKNAKRTKMQKLFQALRRKTRLKLRLFYLRRTLYFIYFSQIYTNITIFIIKYHLQFQSNHYKLINFLKLKSFIYLDNFYSNLMATVIDFLVFLIFYVVDIEVGRAMVFFFFFFGWK